MSSRTCRNLIRNMSPEQLQQLKEHIELQRTSAIVMGKRIDIKLLHFVQAELAGDHPKALEPIHRRPRSGKCRIIKEGVSNVLHTEL